MQTIMNKLKEEKGGERGAVPRRGMKKRRKEWRPRRRGEGLDEGEGGQEEIVVYRKTHAPAWHWSRPKQFNGKCVQCSNHNPTQRIPIVPDRAKRTDHVLLGSIQTQNWENRVQSTGGLDFTNSHLITDCWCISSILCTWTILEVVNIDGGTT